MKRKLIISALGAMLLMCVCILSGCSGKTVIDLKDYVNVTFDGYSGSGTAAVEINTEAMLPLVKDRSIAESFNAETANNGALSNGDTVQVVITFNELMMENAKIEVKNNTLEFPVSGLKEKEKLDVFSGIAFETNGISPECTVSVEFADELLRSMSDATIYDTLNFFNIKLANGETATLSSAVNLKDGDTVTLQITDWALGRLQAIYEVKEISRDFTIEAKSKYILAAGDMNDEQRKALDQIAEDFVNEKISDILSNEDRAARIHLLSQASGMSEGSLYAGATWKIDGLTVKEFNSAYIGKKTVYYFFNAEFSYYIKQMFDIYEGDAESVFAVCVEDPMITPEGVMYSKLTFGSEKNFNDAYNSYITEKFEKLP